MVTNKLQNYIVNVSAKMNPVKLFCVMWIQE